MEPFKNLLNIELIEHCSNLIEKQYPSFQKRKFLASFSTLDSLELKERGNLITQRLDEYMPKDFETCQNIVLNCLLPEKHEKSDDNYFKGWILWPIQMLFIKRIKEYSEHIPEIVHLLKKITSRSSSEFSIRYLIQDHFNIVHPIMVSLAQDENHHIRRWISEGTRPRLPWGIKLDVFCKNPELNSSIIKTLQGDESLYVRKSVANHLNDISKDNPQFVINWINSHLKEAKQNPLLFWTFKHGLRTLIKKGNADALKILGVDDSIEYSEFNSSIQFEQIKKDLSSYQILKIQFNALTESKVILDFRLKHLGIKGTKTKVIKGKTFHSVIGTNQFIKKINLFDNSISKFNIGNYSLEIILNGKVVQELYWKVIQ